MPVRPSPVCTSSTHEERAELPRDLRGCLRRRPASSGSTPPSPSIGSSSTAASSPPGETAASSDSTSFGRAKEIPGTSGPKPSHFAGWPVAESAPSVRPWKPPSSATIRRPPGRLARDLERRLVRLGARVAEEGLRAARSARRGAPRAGASARSSRGSTRARAGRAARAPRQAAAGCTVAEPDDGDPAAEVEVRAACVVPDAAALAADDRDVGTGVGRQHGGPRSRPTRSRSPPSRGHLGRADRRPHAAARGVDRGHQLRDDPALETSRRRARPRPRRPGAPTRPTRRRARPGHRSRRGSARRRGRPREPRPPRRR